MFSSSNAKTPLFDWARVKLEKQNSKCLKIVKYDNQETEVTLYFAPCVGLDKTFNKFPQSNYDNWGGRG